MATQEERRRATLAAIGAAARRLFEQQGFAATTVDSIAATAGVAKGAFYHHYALKEDVFVRVLEGLQEELAREVASGAVKGRTPVQRLRLGLRAYIAACQRSGVRRILLIDGPAVVGWQRWREIDSRYFGAMTYRTVAAALGDDARPAEIAAVTALISGAFAEAALVSAAEPASRVRTRDLVRAMDLLLEGLEKRDTSVTAR
jgi:AcrR family transcriptional regulator